METIVQCECLCAECGIYRAPAKIKLMYHGRGFGSSLYASEDFSHVGDNGVFCVLLHKIRPTKVFALIDIDVFPVLTNESTSIAVGPVL